MTAEDQTELARKIAEAILDSTLCVHCIGIKTGAAARDVAEAFQSMSTTLGLRIDSLAECQACGSRRGVTYSLSRPRAE